MPVLAGWLERPAAERMARETRGWQAADWAVAKRLITIHGLAAHFARSLQLDEIALVMPAPVLEWLLEQDSLNTRRIDRMHAELAAILRAASEAGIEVMPLKGALLTTLSENTRYRRPLGDLDLLVHGTDQLAMRRVMSALGYTHRDEPNPRTMPPDLYVGADGGRVVSIDEHPDNPRKVEIHTAVMRHLWGWTDEDDLTPVLWKHAHSGEILGAPAMVPRLTELFAHVAIHASSDLLVGQGRLVQWLDLADLAPRLEALPVMPHPRICYPSVRLASRVMPHSIPTDALRALESGMPATLVRWAESVTLNSHSGLLVGSTSLRPWTLRQRWRRWQPSRWRLAVAYGAAPLPAALLQHGRVMVGAWSRRTTEAKRRGAVRPDARKH